MAGDCIYSVTAADLNDPVRMIGALTVMARAHEESATKSTRLREAWNGKREEVGRRKLTGRCPEWRSCDGSTAWRRAGWATPP